MAFEQTSFPAHRRSFARRCCSFFCLRLFFCRRESFFVFASFFVFIFGYQGAAVQGRFSQLGVGSGWPSRFVCFAPPSDSGQGDPDVAPLSTLAYLSLICFLRFCWIIMFRHHASDASRHESSTLLCLPLAPKIQVRHTAGVGPRMPDRNTGCLSPPRPPPNYRTHRHEPPVCGGDIKIVSESADELVVDKPCTVPIHPCGSYRWVPSTSLYCCTAEGCRA